MKNLILINGTMGAGKTAVSNELKKRMEPSVFLDGDWCWDMRPFTVNDETKAMVLENIAFLLRQFLACSVFENIIFCWVMHEESIIDDLLSRLRISRTDVYRFTLMLTPESLKAHICGDIARGVRSEGDFERSLERLALYEKMDTVKIWTDSLTPRQAAEQIRLRIKAVPVLETERLLLRPIGLGDAKEAFLWMSDPEVIEFLTFSPHRNAEETERWICRVRRGNPEAKLGWGVSEKETGRLIGFLDAWDSGDFPGRWETGYWLEKASWGKGYAAEALRAVIGYLHEKAGIRKFAAEYARKNGASGRVLQKAGFKEAKNGSYVTADRIRYESRVCFLDF